MAGMSAIFKAAKILGSQKRLADLLGVKAPTVSQWLKGQRPVPVLRCPEIERLTRGEVRCEDLRPDIEWEALRTQATPPSAPVEPPVHPG